MPPEWRVLIADDEPAARRGVRQMLAAFPAFKVASECRNGAEVLQALDVVKPDVVFLDIQMPGIDGFDVIRRRTPERMPPVVFLTAYDTHALKAFEAQALDYLVKPVTQARFDATMKRLTRQLSDVTAGPDPRIVVSTSRGTRTDLTAQVPEGTGVSPGMNAALVRCVACLHEHELPHRADELGCPRCGAPTWISARILPGEDRPEPAPDEDRPREV